MARARLYIVLLSLCVLSSACAKKAKMRTVPRQNAASASDGFAAPTAGPAEGPEDVAANSNPPAKNPEVASNPVPTPAAPKTRLDDSDSGARVRVAAAPTPPRENLTETGNGEIRRPAPVVVTRPRRVAPAPAPRVREEVRVQQFELEAAEELHCRWEPTAKPMTYLKYDPVTKTAYVQHGWPQVWNKYTQVRLVTGLPPYGNTGLSLVAKNGTPIAHLKPTENGTIWYERGTSYPYESYFGRVPGAPQGEAIRGVCWTKSEPAKASESGN